MVQHECLLPRAKRANGALHTAHHEIDDWVADIRRICLDNLQSTAREGRRATLVGRLFPLTARDHLSLSDIVYAACLWGSTTLAICFLTFLLVTRSLESAVDFVLVCSVLIMPLLILWTAIGYRAVNRRERG